MLCFQNNRWVYYSSQFGKPFSVEFKPYKKNELNKNCLIAKVIGLEKHKKSDSPLKVCDISAGFGQDAHVIYQLGCHVECVERSETIATLLQDGFQRAGINIPITICEATEYLKQLSPKEYPDVIYFDPMFPERKKSALVQKSARILKELAGDDLDAKSVFDTALAIAKKRVVVKRALHSDSISEKKPDMVFEGKAIRFDVYLNI